MNSDNGTNRSEYLKEYYKKNKERIAARKKERQEEINAQYRERYATDEEFRRKQIERNRVDKERKETDPEYRKLLQAKDKQHYERYRDYYEGYRANLPTEKKEERNAQHRERYVSDEEFRSSMIASQKKYNKKRLSIEPIPVTADLKAVALERLEEKREDAIRLEDGSIVFTSLQVREITGVSHTRYYAHVRKMAVNAVNYGKKYVVSEADLLKYIDFLVLERNMKKSKH